LVTSRPSVGKNSHLNSAAVVQCEIERADNKADMEAYLTRKLQTNTVLSEAVGQLDADFRPRLLDRAEGNFRWLSIVIDVLNSDAEVGRILTLDRLNVIPAKLSDLYTLALDQTDKEDLPCALAIIALVLPLGSVPISVAEATLSPRFRISNLRSFARINCCAFLQRDEKDASFRVSHDDVSAYFAGIAESQHLHLQWIDAKAAAASCCITLLTKPSIATNAPHIPRVLKSLRNVLDNVTPTPDFLAHLKALVESGKDEFAIHVRSSIISSTADQGPSDELLGWIVALRALSEDEATVLCKALMQRSLSLGIGLVMIQVACTAAFVKQGWDSDDSIAWVVPSTDCSRSFRMTPTELVHILEMSKFKLSDEIHLLVLRMLLIYGLKPPSDFRPMSATKFQNRRQLVYKFLLELCEAFLPSACAPQRLNEELLDARLHLTPVAPLLRSLLRPVNTGILPDDHCRVYKRQYGPAGFQSWLQTFELFDEALLEMS